jgi:hypothetical protein
MIDLEPLRDLTFSATHDHLAAASGIAIAGRFLYVIADDELYLGVFDLSRESVDRKLPLFPGELPDEKRARKKRKPDLEALVRMPPFDGHPSGALLALASGSKPNRQTGALIALDASDGTHGPARAVDLAALYAPLQRRFPGLNLEGATLVDGRLVLLQRASGDHPENAAIRFALTDVLQALAADGDLQLPELPFDAQTVELGHIDGVPLGFTDASALPDGRLVFSAVAEHVDDTYHDGPCVGAMIGVLDTDGHVQTLDAVHPVRKIEGVDARLDGAIVRLLLVTDADDRSKPGELLGATLAV